MAYRSEAFLIGPQARALFRRQQGRAQFIRQVGLPFIGQRDPSILDRHLLDDILERTNIRVVERVVPEERGRRRGGR